MNQSIANPQMSADIRKRFRNRFTKSGSIIIDPVTHISDCGEVFRIMSPLLNEFLQGLCFHATFKTTFGELNEITELLFNRCHSHCENLLPATAAKGLRTNRDNRPSEEGERQIGQNQRTLSPKTTIDGLRHSDQMQCRY